MSYKHLVCAGKRIHETLVDVENEGMTEVVRKYLQECQLMSSLRHPPSKGIVLCSTELYIPQPHTTVEPPNKGHIGTSHFVLYREVVLSLEVKNSLA